MNFISRKLVFCGIVFKLCRVVGGISDSGSAGSGSSSNLYNEIDIPGEPLSPLDFKNAEELSSYYGAYNAPENMSLNDPTEKAGLFEGDIVIDDDDNPSNVYEKTAIKDVRGKWKNGTVPYLISLKFNEHERSVIARAVLEFQRQTCITFTPRGTEQDYIMITTGDGCSSPVGRVGGPQYVTLGNGCLYTGIIMHEFMHTIGFWHEQSRWDRDDHVVIFFENIQPGREENFRKISWKETQNLSVPYDTSSIMHYGPYAFSKNRQKHYKTMTPKVSNDKMGQRTNFSEIDVLKIIKLYKCSKKSDGGKEQGAGPESESTVTTQSPNSSNSSYESQTCEDNHPNCQKWAGSGECQKNPSWMMVNCKQSCNQCRAPCSNNNKHCDAWAANGECSKNPGYMNAHCAKACKKCRQR